MVGGKRREESIRGSGFNKKSPRSALRRLIRSTADKPEIRCAGEGDSRRDDPKKKSRGQKRNFLGETLAQDLKGKRRNTPGMKSTCERRVQVER